MGGVGILRLPNACNNKGVFFDGAENSDAALSSPAVIKESLNLFVDDIGEGINGLSQGFPHFALSLEFFITMAHALSDALLEL